MLVEEPPGAVEVVAYGADRPRRRLPAPLRVVLRASVLVPLLLVAAVSAYVLDDRARDGEYDALVERVAAADDAVDLAESRVVSIKQYVSPTLFSAEAPVTLRRDLARLVRGTADEAASDLAVERERVVALSVRPWHGDQQAARDALVAYLEERQGRLLTVLADVSSATTYPRLAELRVALADAAPDPERADQAAAALR